MNRIVSIIAFLVLTGISASAQVPGINYQGRVSVNGTNFDGIGQFKFALVDATGAATFWSNGVNAVSLAVTKGLYSILLGDTAIVNMETAIPASVFTNSDVRLRVWFNDGVSGLQQLSPDQRIAAVGYALMAANVLDGTITGNKLAAGAIGGAQLASNLTISGTVTAAGFQGNGAVLWQTVADTTLQARANTGYLLTNAAPSVLMLPATANVGDIVRVSGVGTGGWAVGAAIDQAIAGDGVTVGGVWTPRASARSWVSVASSADGTKLVAADAGGHIYTSADSGATWGSRDVTGDWMAVASSADGTMLVAAAGGPEGRIFTSTDSGLNWTPRDSNRGWVSVASSADGTMLVAVEYGGQIYTSTNSGVTWTPRESNREWQAVTSSADGTKLVAVVLGGQIYTSTDAGATWTPRDSNRQWNAAATSADGMKLVAVDAGNGDGGRIYTSTDSGVSWTPRESNRGWTSVASSADGTMLVATDWARRIYTSTNSGLTWTPRESYRYWRSVASSADGRKLVAAAFSDQLYTSLPSLVGTQGTTAALQYLGNGVWQPLNEALIGAGTVGTVQLAANAVQSANIAAGAVDGAQLASNVTVRGTVTATGFQGNGASPWQTVAGTTQQAVANTGYLLTNGTQSVLALPSSANVGDIVRVSSVGAGGWVVAVNSNEVVNSGNLQAGIVWTPRETDRNWRSVASSADGTKLVAVVEDGRIYTSADAGLTWTPRESDRYWRSVASSADGTKLVAVEYTGWHYTSTNSGVSWTTAFNNSQHWMAAASSADGTKLVTVAKDNYIYVSADSGATWGSRETLRSWQSVASSADGTKLVAVVEDGQIYTSADAGLTWTPRESDRYWRSVASSADGTKLVAVVDGGQIYTSADAGLTWTPRESNRLWRSVTSSADGTKLVAVVDGGQIYTSADAGLTWTPRESDRLWRSVTSSADGTKLVAVVDGGQLYTSLASYTWGQGTSVALQYLGNNVWQPMNEAMIAAGSVGSAQLASNLTVSGTLAAAALSGDGSALISLNASQLTRGIVPDARLSGTYSSALALSNAGNSFTGTFAGNGATLTNVPSATTAHYVFAYDTTTQTVAVASTFQDVTVDTDAQISGWAHTAGTAAFTCNQAGLYMVQYHAVASLPLATSAASLLLVVNGTEVSGSQSSTGPTGSTNVTLGVSKSALVSLASGDVLKLQVSGATTSDQLLPNNGSGTTSPSVSLTIIRIQ